MVIIERLQPESFAPAFDVKARVDQGHGDFLSWLDAAKRPDACLTALDEDECIRFARVVEHGQCDIKAVDNRRLVC